MGTLAKDTEKTSDGCKDVKRQRNINPYLNNFLGRKLKQLRGVARSKKCKKGDIVRWVVK